MPDAAVKKIKIVFLIPSLGIGGAEWQLYYLLRGLDREKYALFLVVFYSTGRLRPLFDDLQDLQIIYLNKKSGLDFACYFPLVKFLRRDRMDIVHAYNTSARWMGFLLARWRKIPCTIMAERNAGPVYSSFGSRIYHLLDSWAVRRANWVIANSEAGREYAVSRGAAVQRTSVIQNGLDRQRLQFRHTRSELNLPMERPIIGMVARMTPQKDHRTFLQAARILRQQYNNIFFVLVGGGPELKAMKQLAGELELAEHICFCGEIDHPIDYLAAMDLVVLTSKTSEGCANAVLEAMALAKPVVVTDVPGNRELIGHRQTGLIIPPMNPSALADAVSMLMDDDELAKRLGRQAAQQAENTFNLDHMIAGHARIYDSLMKDQIVSG